MRQHADASPFRLGCRWEITGDLATVYRYVSDARTFPQWFSVFREVRPDDPTGPLRVGSHVACHVRALLPYTLAWDITVARYEPPRRVELACRVVLGGRMGLHGYVRYRFEAHGPLVTVINEQELSADRPVPRLLQPLTQAVQFNRDWAMRQAAAPLQRIVRLAPAPAA